MPRCSEVFGLQRFRECELIHGRWAMLACLGALVQEAVTGDSWVAAQVRGGHADDQGDTSKQAPPAPGLSPAAKGPLDQWMMMLRILMSDA